MWFKKQHSPRVPSTAAELNDRELNPVASAKFTTESSEGLLAAASAYEDAAYQLEYDEFCEKFCYRPGQNLMRDYVLAERDSRLIAWLDWKGHEPEAKAFVRLMLLMMRAGEKIWDQPGITMFRQGQWSTGGAPSPASQEALSVIAQLIGKRISLCYKLTAIAPSTDLKVLWFEP